MRRFAALFLAALVVFGATPSFACYSAEEAAAEQTIRLHSELMVIAVTCKYGPGNVSLFDAYSGFGRDHNAALRAAEAQLIAYYKRSGKQGIAELDHFRTVLGNEYSNEAAMSGDTQIWCNQNSHRMVEAARWTEPQLQQQVSQRTQLAGMPMCPVVGTQTAVKSR